MQADGQAGDQRLLERLDDLQARVAHLEQVYLSQVADAYLEEAPTDPAMASQHATGAQTTLDEADVSLRAMQLEATADLDQEWRGSAAVHATGTGRSFDLAWVEERLAGRAMAVAGGTALILGAVFFLSLAFSRGWIGPGLQVTLGVAGGAIGLLVGAVLLRRGDRLVGHVLTAVGLAVVSLSFFAATTLYGLLPGAVGLAGAFVTATVATLIAISTRSQIVAGFGLVALLAAPPLLGAEPDTLSFLYMVTALAGIAAISLWQTWSWLPPLAFLLSAPQIYIWIDSDPGNMVGTGALLLYWGLMAVAAGGEAFRRQGRELSITSAPLLLGAGAFVVFLAFDLLTTDAQQVAFLLALSALHGIIAALFIVRRGPVDPFGLLAGAYGVGIASMAVPLLFDASLTAMVWSVEAAALAVLAGRRAHGPSLIAGLAMLVIAASRLSLQAVETAVAGPSGTAAVLGPLDSLSIGLAAFLVAATVFVAVVPDRAVRLTVVAIAVLTCLPVIYLKLEGVALVASSILLGVTALAAPRWLSITGASPTRWQLGPALEWLRPKRSLAAEAEGLTLAAAAIAGMLAMAGTVVATVAQDGLPGIPFTDTAGASALILASGLLVAGLLSHGAARRRAVIATGLVVALTVVFQVPIIWAVVAWSILAVIGFALGARDDGGTLSYSGAAAIALGAVAVAALVYAPPDRLMVNRMDLAAHPPFISEATLVLGALAIALAIAARLRRSARWAALALAAAGATLLYLLSVNVVDLFSTQVYGLIRVPAARAADLAKEAQVALSVLWTVVGVVVIGAGLAFRNRALRIGGLAILAVASTKVLLVDLSSLDVAYRVITLLILGLVLLISAFAWTRMKPASAQEDADAKPKVPASDSVPGQ
ncbi:MAG: DUF2339 domain-containing protein [Chloroflexota bacterium]